MSKSNKIVALRCALIVGLIVWAIMSWYAGAIVLGLVPAVLSSLYQIGHIWVEISHRRTDHHDPPATD